MGTQQLIDEFIEILNQQITVGGQEGHGEINDIEIADDVGVCHKGCSGYFQVKLEALIRNKGEHHNLSVIETVENAPFLIPRPPHL